MIEIGLIETSVIEKAGGRKRLDEARCTKLFQGTTGGYQNCAVHLSWSDP